MLKADFKKKLLILGAVLLVMVNLYLISLLIEGPKFGIRSDIALSQEFPELENIRDEVSNLEEATDFFTKIAEDKGSHYAYYALVNAASVPGMIAEGIDIHLLGHVVGDLLYQELGLDGIEICTHDLRNACSHSIVIGAFIEDGTDALDEIAEVCRNAPGGPGAYTMCFHGLGHGVLSYTGYRMEEAIELCKQTGTEEYFDREYIECAGGIVMEMMAGIADQEVWQSQKDNYFKEDDPLSPCNLDFMPKEVQPICYSYLTPHLIQFAGGTLADPQEEHFVKAFEYCDRIPQDQQANRRTCFGGMGKDFIVLAADHSIASVEFMTPEQLRTVYDWCLLTDDEQGQRDCVGNAMASLYWGGENAPDTAINFCDEIPDSGIRDFCFNHFFSAVRSYVLDESQRLDVCKLAPRDQRSKCEGEVSSEAY